VRPGDIPWHSQDIEPALAAVQGTRRGLTGAEAAARLASHGPNRLPEPKRRGPLRRFLAQFNSLLIQILLVAAVVTAALGYMVDTAVIAGVAVLNAVIGYVQEGRAEQALRAIMQMMAPGASVLRDGQRLAIAATDIVPGDIVLLEAGDRVPADLRLLEAAGLRIEEAALTGESVPVQKSIEPVAAAAPIGDRASIAHAGTLVVGGQGLGLAVATGAGTEIGKITGLLAGVVEMTTPLLRQMNQFARWLTGIILVAAAAVFAFGYLFRGYALEEMFLIVVGLAVAAIPSGLPAALTVTLAIGVQRMAARRAIIRRLPAVETLGSVSVICSDKTGTLTRNQMVLRAIATAEADFAVEGTGYAPQGRILASDGTTPPPAELLRAALLCNDAALAETGGVWSVAGDPMEGALIVGAMKAGLDPQAEAAAWPRIAVIPFDAAHRYMATLHEGPNGARQVMVKGAPEPLIAMACTAVGPDGPVPLDPDAWHARIETLAAEGQRVLALARCDLPEGDLTPEAIAGRLELLGLVGLIDPPRDEAIVAVADCRSAGIAVKMITGDHAGTARAIARQLGLQHGDAVLTGVEIDALDDAALQARVMAVDVFARTSPAHKLRLVQALQAGGQVVAMTGDGVNDAPALKQAEVGVAMGITGTAAAKEAAEMVLADDNFASIAAAVREGRNVYDNLRKSITFLLPINGGESIAIVAAILMGVTLPITHLQVLWVNLVSSVVLAMALAFEPAEPDIMARPPRPPHEPLLSGFLLWRVLFVSTLFFAGIFGIFQWTQAQGASLELSRTYAVNTLVVMEVFYLFSVRYLRAPSLSLAGLRGTRHVLIAIAAVVVLQLAFTYAPFMALFFDTRPLGFDNMLLVFGIGVAVFAALETEKALLRRFGTAGGGQA